MDNLTHAHEVIDKDLPFVIDPITLTVSEQSIHGQPASLTVPQHSKNSQRLTFTIPDRYIEGHDMSEVNQAFVHFRNVGTQGQLSAGIYKVEDLAVAEDSVSLSWLIDDDATYYVGALIFSLHFICTDDAGNVVYVLPTLAYSKISVGETVWNSEEITKKYPDIIAQLEARISAIEAGGVPGGTVTPIAYLYNGVELPALPNWDKATYPYAVITLRESIGLYYLSVHKELRYYERPGLPGGDYITYFGDSTPGTALLYTWQEGMAAWDLFDKDNWSISVERDDNGKDIPLWANFDLLDDAGELYVGASEPVPVYPEGGGTADAVLYTEQTLTPEQQAQARENIGAAGYYSAESEALGVEHESINADYVYGLYDALMAEFPGKVQKNEIHNNDGSFTNYEYVISTGEYNTEGVYSETFGFDSQIKKPKYLLLSGIHGQERKIVFSTYRFIRDALRGHNVPASFIEGVNLHVVPVGTPDGFDAFNRQNSNGVDVNRNFAWNWKKFSDGTSGTAAESEKETQAIVNWLKANLDADLFIDMHNSGATQEVAVVLGLPENDAVDSMKKIALRGLGRVTPYWRDVVGYTSVEGALADGTAAVQDVIYAYSASISVNGVAACYATGVLGIPSIAIEALTYKGAYTEWLANKQVYPPETIAMGSEVLGNILVELYEQSIVSEVNEMTNTIELLAESVNSMSKGFRTESGVLVVDADLLPASGSSTVTVRIPCSNGAKTVDFHADADTLAAIRASQGKSYLGSFLGNFYAPNAGWVALIDAPSSFMVTLQYESTLTQYNGGWLLRGGANSKASNADGCTVPVNALKAGRYEWTAYYWND